MHEGAPKISAEDRNEENKGEKSAVKMTRRGMLAGGLAALAAGTTLLNKPAQAMHEWPDTPLMKRREAAQKEGAPRHREVLKGILSSHGVSDDEMRRWDNLGPARDEKYLNQAGMILLEKESELQDRLRALRKTHGEKTSHLELVRNSVEDIEKLFAAAENLAFTSEDELAQSEQMLRSTYRATRGLREIAREHLSAEE